MLAQRARRQAGPYATLIPDLHSLFGCQGAKNRLRDQTNREGLFDNQAFRDMRSFVLKCIEVFETDRQSYERSRQPEQPQTLGDSIEDAKQQVIEEVERLAEALKSQPDSPQKDVLASALAQFKESQVQTLEGLESAYEEEQQETADKFQLMQNLATVGIAVSAMGHELLDTSRKVVNVIDRLIRRIGSSMLFCVDSPDRVIITDDLVCSMTRQLAP